MIDVHFFLPLANIVQTDSETRLKISVAGVTNFDFFSKPENRFCFLLSRNVLNIKTLLVLSGKKQPLF